jgi:hypothetical protein
MISRLCTTGVSTICGLFLFGLSGSARAQIVDGPPWGIGTYQGGETAIYAVTSGSGSVCGAFGESAASGVGVSGFATASTGVGVFGSAGGNFTAPTGEAFGGYFVAPGTGGAALYGNAVSSGGTGVLGTGYGVGVQGSSTGSSGNGVIGLYGSATASSLGNKSGVYGASDTDNGVFGTITGSAAGAAVSGVDQTTNQSQYGVFGSSGSGFGVYGNASSGVGVLGQGEFGVIGRATQTNGYAGYFEGNVWVQSLTCGSGCSSDRRLKDNIKPMTGALATLLELKGVTFEWRKPEEHQNHAGPQTGVIAQDVQKVFPQWVHENPDGFLSVDPDARSVLGLTVEGFRELKTENGELRDRIRSLEAGRRPMMSGFGEGGIGLGLVAVAGALVMTRRKRPEEQA